MKVECAHDKIVDINELKPNPRNPNKHPKKQIEMLAKIIKYQGWRSPIVVSNRSGFIVKGHGRLEAAKLNLFTEVPIDYQDYVTEADEWADMVADNKIQELAEADEYMLAELTMEFPKDFDLELAGLDVLDITNDILKINEKEIDENLETKNECPSCSYKW